MMGSYALIDRSANEFSQRFFAEHSVMAPAKHYQSGTEAADALVAPVAMGVAQMG